ncbi:hypothetical protein GCM10017653_12440 [Ancylobacter defluvii]|uniref:Uncharacterized protein n=1 Tax=Ancylobacter defluvii TaxID=1282440 RepID=A0A9W6JSU5_9HYPH|nr:hypothetical protein GCM10017653_12440 [Ancylobacter defluvii]
MPRRDAQWGVADLELQPLVPAKECLRDEGNADSWFLIRGLLLIEAQILRAQSALQMPPTVL